ncbi:MAG: hypothetical protein ACC633_06720 [Anaerolineales bacterium]
MDLISNLISSFDPSAPNFRPTELYNESWLIKIVLHQASLIDDQDCLISFLPKSTWFSEGLLPTAFKERFRGDKLSESRTNADGVIGQIRIGQKAKADLELVEDASQFTVVEAKVGAPLSAGTSNAIYFDQDARNAACMAEVMARADIEPASLDRLAFVVLAPQYSIEKGTFVAEISPTSIQEKVKKRVDAYDGELDYWYVKYFEPTLNNIQIKSLSWESVLEWISVHQSDVTEQLRTYYDLCLQFK